MRILVTGGAGFIASHIVDALIEQRHTVAVVDKLSTGFVENINKRARFYPIDILDDALEDVFAVFRPEVVIHHAAQIDGQMSLRQPRFDAETNIIGTLNVLERCIEHKTRKIICASSAAVYGPPAAPVIREDHPIRPLTGYGISKYTSETYIRMYGEQHNLDFTILRYANVYGERQGAKGEAGVVSIFADRLLAGEAPIIYGDGEQVRDFIYVKDVVAANLQALSLGHCCTVNIGTGERTSVNRLFGFLRDLTGSGTQPVYQAERTGDIKHSCLDNTLAASVLAWRPVHTLESGLASTVRDRAGLAVTARNQTTL
ncbi:UDP-glucose 4-epimerase [Paenibacillus darwinianus]|uniref:UDP-glucose 4-epimerase n=1 Tax=Paenibacillus darwinianus TaxID=1380763 RepID=A0A9W5W736_9BACL|nr:NAD-dependent epimerase/dehydratase family protein [Paenibacillus darwinianus]EXX84799.1 UDP-glucose 4-epimerase [Paenibacillus darwinianus]EXX88504.1 UDP-glucose 4-epimerase [Paenibacillus darwinianus]EXX88650.1 UDP-glucose 4-epimerase [Paenibacillus darwinianus]